MIEEKILGKIPQLEIKISFSKFLYAADLRLHVRTEPNHIELASSGKIRLGPKNLIVSSLTKLSLEGNLLFSKTNIAGSGIDEKYQWKDGEVIYLADDEERVLTQDPALPVYDPNSLLYWVATDGINGKESGEVQLAISGRIKKYQFAKSAAGYEVFENSRCLATIDNTKSEKLILAINRFKIRIPVHIEEVPKN